MRFISYCTPCWRFTVFNCPRRPSQISPERWQSSYLPIIVRQTGCHMSYATHPPLELTSSLIDLTPLLAPIRSTRRMAQTGTDYKILTLRCQKLMAIIPKYRVWMNISKYSGEMSPTRCNNCVFYSQWFYSTCFGWQSHPSSGVQCCIWPQVSWLT